MGKGRKRNPYAKADRFTKQAKEEGYQARSVYKLTAIQRRFRVFHSGQRVVDLGCCPGSWSTYAKESIGHKGILVGIDISETALPGGLFLHKSIRDLGEGELLGHLGGPADVVLSDMAPRTTGNLLGDHVEQIELAALAADVADDILKPGGTFICKLFDGEDAPPFVLRLRKAYAKTKRVKPEAVRRNSREFFMVCQDKR
jgi:23S rRNA (uridine2552-2'-O)-methyltransferase